MNKRGFTLSELIIAMGIIGVVAAVTAPSIQKIFPDKDKGIVLKNFGIIKKINQDIFNNPSLYWQDTTCSQKILQCVNRPLDKETNTIHDSANYEGVNKYPYLVADSLTLVDSISHSGNTYSFTTSDGVIWTIDANINPSASSGLIPPEYYIITIDPGTSNRDNCTYHKTQCKNPRKYSFKIDNKGVLSANDNLTKIYLMNSDNLSGRKDDLKSASEL